MIKWTVVYGVLLLSFQAQAIDSYQLSQETTKLYERLDRQDPLRMQLALRLADLSFDAATDMDKRGNLKPAEEKQLEVLRTRAMELYTNVLTGFNGQFKAPGDRQNMLIRYQIARLHGSRGEFAKANVIWKDLSDQKMDSQIRREAALVLAEFLELSQKGPDLIEAGRLYDVALSLCDADRVCGYVKYRRSWIDFRLGRSDVAVEGVLKSYEKAEPSMIPEVLDAIVLFVSRSTMKTADAISLLEKLDLKHHKGLVQKLATAYQTADQRASFKETLVYMQTKNPKLDRLIELAEVEYSNRNVQGLSTLLDALVSEKNRGVTFTDDTKAKEAEKVFYRLVVQFDGERERRPEFASVFDKSVPVYFELFPKGPNVEKVVQGWLAFETKPARKIQILKVWADMLVNFNPAVSQKLHQSRLGAAKAAKDQAVVIEETEILARWTTDTNERRQLTYGRAKALYDLGEYDKALPVFLEFSNLDKKPDEISLFSVNLALDIYSKKGDLEKLQGLANTWVHHPKSAEWAKTDPKLAHELGEMQEMSAKAQFQVASTKKDDDSLKLFVTHCENKKFLPQSCENAEKLSILQKRQDYLIRVLKSQGKMDQLMSEYETGGFFVESAQLQEKKLGRVSLSRFEESFRIAILYEMGGAFEDQRRILISLYDEFLASKKPVSKDLEGLLFATFEEMDFINLKSLAAPWSPERKLALAVRFENQGLGTKETTQMLSEKCEALGPRWEQLQMAKLQAGYQKQKAIGFVGKASQKFFEKRVAALKDLAESTSCLLQGAQPELAYGVRVLISKAFTELADEIKSVKIPEGLDPETLEKVNAQIAQTALPFEEKSKQWLSQAEADLSQAGKVVTEDLTKQFVRWDYQFKKPEEKKEIVAKKFDWQPLLASFQEKPFEKDRMLALKDHLNDRKRVRLAAYMNGRINALEKRGGN